ncbi:hypothetical protein C8F04DRAFT_1260516 [Mycena alexandri]|uniref:Uncharacterized protein n=1 Tax=Mycena alexandri TaxID=1745969 RepID=A0AAD6STI8_9AGAR|nr:hypothetical protein C8F04DRAFT_1260516 [Mycena alexandri]
MPRTGPTAPSGHALRHLGHQVQLSRPRASKSKATRASDDLRLATVRKSKSLLNAAIDAEFLRREEAIGEIAESSNRKPQYVRSLLSSASQYKATRKPSLRNAVIHQRCIDQPEGSHKTLQEIREDLAEEIREDLAEDERLGLFDLTRIDDDEKKRLIKQLLEHRKFRRTGIRATTKSQQLDNTRTGLSMGNTLNDLFERTGDRGIVMLSRGKADDPTAFGLSKVEVVQKFEQYNVSRDDGTDEQNGVREMRKAVGRTLLDGLTLIAGKKQHKMEYLNYDVAIREGKGVELAGWPADIKFADHANWNAETLRRVRSSLHSGAIHWVKMTKTQHDELVAKHDAQRQALGAGSLRPRKQRSDKGEARGPQKNKKQAAAGKTKGRSRREKEEDEDEDSDEDDSDKEDDNASIEQHAHGGATSTPTTPPTLIPGVGLTSSLAVAIPALATHLPTFVISDNFDFEDPEFLEMLNDPTAWMAAEGGSTAPQTDAGSMAFVTPPLSLEYNSTSALALSSNAAGNSIAATHSNGAGSSKRKRAAEDESTQRPKKSRKAKGVENTPPAAADGEPVKKPRKKRSDAGVPRKSKNGAGSTV